MQDAIRECFKDCTVLTIAHRLRTIIDSDRIMCLSQGKLEDFGTPYELLMNHRTILHSLVFSLDKMESDKLVEIAKQSHLNKKSNKIENLNEETTENQIDKKEEEEDYSPKETDDLLMNKTPHENN